MSHELAYGPALDASALLAFLHSEPGFDQVESALDGSAVSSVNWCEVLQRCQAKGVDTDRLQQDMEALGVRIVAFDATDAFTAAGLWKRTQARGLSLADRACLSLALKLKTAVLTADRAWKKLELPVNIKLIR